MPRPRAANSTDAPPRPKLAFRVGVTGTQNLVELQSEVQESIRQQVHDVLTVVRETVERFAASDEALAVYATTDGKVTPSLRVVSPLAEGADRLVAEVATGLGFEPDIALPFERKDYAADFETPGSLADFDGWLDEPPGRVFLEIDGPTGRQKKDARVAEEDNLAYEAVGRLVARNCDLMIAIWNGQPASGRGGTAEIARFCARSGRPVWWIDAKGVATPRFVTATTRLRWQENSVSGEAARAALLTWIDDNLAVASAGSGEHDHESVEDHGDGHDHGDEHSLIARGMHGLYRVGRRLPEALRTPWHRWFAPSGDPLRTYLNERAHPERWPWRLYGFSYRRLAGPSSLEDRRIEVPAGPALYWKAFYEPADRASKEYGNRYRSSYVWILLLATAAVVCAVLSLGYKDVKSWATLAEFLILLVVLGLAVVNIQRKWHRRWIAYRMLAELCRKQAALAVLGWSLPPPDLRRFHGEAAPEAWVARYFNAAVRAAPLPSGRFRGPQLEQARRYVQEALIDEQKTYHEDRRRRSRLAGVWLVKAGEVFFVVTLACVTLKLLLIGLAPTAHQSGAHGHHGVDYWHVAVVLLGVAAAILPALSAASVGVRAYAELELLESQSRRMARVMSRAHDRIGDLDLSHTLASQDLAAEVFDTATEMLREVEGWAELFRVKAVEAG